MYFCFSLEISSLTQKLPRILLFCFQVFGDCPGVFMFRTCLFWYMIHGLSKRMCMLLFGVEFSINVSYILLIDGVVEFFSILADTLSSCSSNC